MFIVKAFILEDGEEDLCVRSEETEFADVALLIKENWELTHRVDLVTIEEISTHHQAFQDLT
jgi:hypothetical protein